MNLQRTLPIFVAALTTIGLMAGKQASAQPWITAYLPAWEVSQNGVSPSGVDYKSITHLVWFSLTPTSSGSIVETSGDPGVNANAAAVASAVHSAGKKVLISIGGSGSEPAFDAAFNAGKTTTLVNSIVSWVSQNGYDGVDIDDEPMQAGDASQYQAFIKALRTALPSGDALTAAAEPFGAATSSFAALSSTFTQVNIMTYDMIYGNGLANGSGEMTWYNSPITSGSNYEQTGPAMPSIAQAVGNFESAGVPASKLGIGSAFYGYIFPGATNIMQAYTGAWPPNALSYAQIMGSSQYYSSTYYHYDSTCNAAYISRTDTGNFITYDDTTAVTAKVNYVGSKGLGGLVCFEIGQQYMSGQNPLLKAIDSALGSGGGSAPANGINTLTPACATGSRLDDYAAATTNGNKIDIYQANNSAAQNWNFALVAGSNEWNMAVLGPYCLSSGSSATGSPYELWACNGASDQTLVSGSAAQSGYYNFAALGYNECMTVTGGGSANYTVVENEPCNGSTSQAWAITPN